VDALINYEAVKVSLLRRVSRNSFTHLQRQSFGNEKWEVAQYDKALAAYEQSSVKISTSLAFLNSGQNVIFSSALTAMMFMAAQGVVNGAFALQRLMWVLKRAQAR
jgi:ATP-binding cassette subfamily B (MDR/TAP) protein 7